VLSVRDHAGLAAAELERLRGQLAVFSMLEDVVRWGYATTPPREVAEVVVQNEYSHDVVVAWEDGRYLVFDTT